MDELVAGLRTLHAHPDFWGIVSIPIVAAIVTWGHVWMAIQMVFYPIEFLGYRPLWLGWQGIIPRKAEKMAGIVVDKTLTKLGTVGDFLNEMNPELIAAYVANAIERRIEEIVDEVMEERNRVFWQNLPRGVRRRVYDHIRSRLPDVMLEMMMEIMADVDNLVDIREMVVRQMAGDRALMVRMFQEVGHKEFKFIVDISFWIGLGFGFLQMILFYFVPAHWLLPAYAATLGLLTNWIALAMVFRPLHPVKVGPFRIQGVFLKRQDEVAEKFAELSANELLTIGRITREIITGKYSSRTRSIVKRRLMPILESPVTRATMQITLGTEGFAAMRDTVADKSADFALDPMEDERFNKDRAKVLQARLAEKIRALPTEEFQDMLRPAFQEDEWILLVLGAVTGLAAGTLQLLLGFS
ncbi:hypothetical protein L2U69_05645 [Zavarzinia compransoris]|uniref:DUF445 domain-containing protein n=1 Tax=Zavarzinia marina TaxID=2911065 RepID=UPI001F2D8B5B|nr:hypothetical protein [Zavarzinia marina]MCF4165118.1 hypothetical protein [Zavarzinia marina]